VLGLFFFLYRSLDDVARARQVVNQAAADERRGAGMIDVAALAAP